MIAVGIQSLYFWAVDAEVIVSSNEPEENRRADDRVGYVGIRRGSTSFLYVKWSKLDADFLR